MSRNYVYHNVVDYVRNSHGYRYNTCTEGGSCRCTHQHVTWCNKISIVYCKWAIYTCT